MPSCEATLSTLSLWTKAEGVRGSLLVHGWSTVAVLDTGGVLGWGVVLDGPLPEGAPVPEHRLLGISPEAQVVVELSYDPSAYEAIATRLGDGRALVFMADPGPSTANDVLLVDLADGSLTTLLSQAATTYPSFDGRKRILSIGESRPGGMVLHWGRLP